jgi:hypothetical protein
VTHDQIGTYMDNIHGDLSIQSHHRHGTLHLPELPKQISEDVKFIMKLSKIRVRGSHPEIHMILLELIVLGAYLLTVLQPYVRISFFIP